MSVALRTITRLQDADDINVSLGAGVDEYALCWDNDTARFVLRAMSGGGVTDHGALTGLSDDDHGQYLLATGARTGASSQAQTFTNGIIGPTWKPATDATDALKLTNAAGTAIVALDTTNRRLNINSATSTAALSIQPYSADDGNVYLRNSSGTLVGAISTGASSVSFSGQGSADFQFITASGKAFIFKQIVGYISFRDYQDYEAARVTDAEWAFNYNGNPSFDVRIRSATLSHLFFADGSADRIGIGDASPASRLDIGAGALTLSEMTAPDAPAANDAVIYVDDNGSGKTRLMVRFASGAAQQIAIEP